MCELDRCQADQRRWAASNEELAELELAWSLTWNDDGVKKEHFRLMTEAVHRQCCPCAVALS